MKPTSPFAKVRFFYQNTNPALKNRSRLKVFIPLIFQEEKKKLGELRIIFCTDDVLLNINKDFLQHDYYTDVISFDLSESEAIEAEIYISDDRIRDNAFLHGATIKMELHRVIFHGILHLCGYGDKTKAERRLMAEKEDYYLAKYFR